MAEPTASGATYEDESEALEDPRSFVKLWLDALNQADSDEKDWRKGADEAVEAFRGKKGSGSRAFNVVHANIETICPALYNSTPSPDVRRRYADADPVGKVVADLIERALSYSIDSYDIDHVMKSMLRDGELVGRGMPRVRYVPTVAGPAGQEAVVAQEVYSDYVPWKYFRHGPGLVWSDVPWVAFGDFLTRDGLRSLCGDAKDAAGKLIAEEIPLNHSAADQKDKKSGAPNSVFKQALVWQIWDKDKGEVISICPDYAEAPLKIVEDPLGLKGFFPVPRPYQPILSTEGLVPVIPYDIYKDLAKELNELTSRISKLVRQVRPRALYGGDANDLKAVSEADDGELIPATKIEAFIENGGLEKALAFWPLDPIINALKQLMVQRAEVKQIIYEVTGASDILRGATQASETATAQQIKAQWGSLRIQDRQAEIQRVVRDVFRLKAEIIASKFTFETLADMTGIKLPTAQQQAQARQMIAAFEASQQAQAAGMGHNGGPPMDGQPAPQPMPQPAPTMQPPTDDIVAAAKTPSQEEVAAVMRPDLMRSYRIDIESDSTIRGDLTRNQQTMNLFLQGTAQFAQAMGPIIQLDRSMLQPALEVYTAFARQFKLGKQAEDALDALADKARQAGSAPPPQPKPNPQVEAAQARADADIASTKMNLQAKTAEHGMDMQKLEAKAALSNPGLMPPQPAAPMPPMQSGMA